MITTDVRWQARQRREGMNIHPPFVRKASAVAGMGICLQDGQEARRGRGESGRRNAEEGERERERQRTQEIDNEYRGPSVYDPSLFRNVCHKTGRPRGDKREGTRRSANRVDRGGRVFN